MPKGINHSACLKAKIALAALKEDKTLSELSQEFKIHPSQIAKWKSQAIKELASLFETGRPKKPVAEIDTDALYAQIGKLQSQLEFLKKKMGIKS